MTQSATKPPLLVTGGSGRLGQAIARQLGDAFRIFNLDPEPAEHPLSDVTHIPINIGSHESMETAFREVKRQAGERLATVVHLAEYHDYSGEPSPLYDEVTVHGTARLLTCLRDFQVDQLIFSSTMLVHAPREPGERIQERSRINPKWVYPRSKLKAEQLLRQRHRDIPLVVLRFAGMYDDGCHSFALAHQIQRIYERRWNRSVYPGDFRRGQAFVHIDDAADAVTRAVTQRFSLLPQTTLLIGEPTTYSYGNLQNELDRLILGKESEIYWIPKTFAKAGAWARDNLPFLDSPTLKPWMVERADDHYELDISRATEVLDWSPLNSLWNTLPKMIETLSVDPSRWYREHGLEWSEELRHVTSS